MSSVDPGSDGSGLHVRGADPGLHPRGVPRFTARQLASLLFVIAVLASGVLLAQYQKKPPDFGGSYSFPTPTHPEPKDAALHVLDVVMLVAGLGLGAWLVLKRRTRNGMLMLSVGTIAYFGFYRQGCICPIGAIQNVTASLVDPRYTISFGVIAFFFLPLAATLLFGRVFCGGVCPLGAVQDLVLIRPVTVPAKLDKALRWLPYVYLGLAILFAGWGLHVSLGGWQLNIGRRFIICEWDPFISLFRISGSFHMLVIGGVFILGGMFVGRPYCRWLCPVRRDPRHPVARRVEEREHHAEQGSRLRPVRRRVPVRRDSQASAPTADVRVVRPLLRVVPVRDRTPRRPERRRATRAPGEAVSRPRWMAIGAILARDRGRGRGGGVVRLAGRASSSTRGTSRPSRRPPSRR